MPQYVAVFEPQGIDYFVDFPACTVSSLLPDARFAEVGSPSRLQFTQTVQNPHSGRRYRLPVVWEATVQISRRRCYLTTKGDRELFPDEPALPAVASCWLEACPTGTPGATSPEDWRALLARLEGLFRESCEDISLQELTWWRRGAPSSDMLQVKWDLVDTRDVPLDEAFPLYTRDGERLVPESLEEVPFGEPVRVLFILWSIGDEKQRLAAAEYYFIQLL
ncbi:hypothetical protein C8T65DRAFT_747655 [Cerioporus squamosus]|nr:hypothetical protein C8T65DRAFT_747655 [Cerioporus squamosus]